ncbi:MAG: AAA family ATPase [Patescibacteria group bacterium]
MPWRTIGFEAQKKRWEQGLPAGAHAFLWSGLGGIGKRTLALELTERIQPDPGARIVIAPKDDSGDHTISIEAVRDIIPLTTLASAHGPLCIIIDDIESLSREAANAFLKTLEEPRGPTVFIGITSRPGSVLPTIRSRCVGESFSAHADAVITVLPEIQSLAQEDRANAVAIACGRIGWVKRAHADGALVTLCAHASAFERLQTQGVAERMLYAQKLIADEALSEALDVWVAAAQRNASAFASRPHILRGLLDLAESARFSNANQRIALESFLLSF